jgi:nucleoside-diphosphate-sugar epimerase
MRCFVIGGTGVISASCVGSLLAGGHDVTTFSRGFRKPDGGLAGATAVQGDRNDPEALSRALARVKPDVVLDFACFTLEQADGLIDAIPSGCRQFVFVSTVDVYGLPLSHLPMREADPWSAPRSAYAADKRAVERRFEDALRWSETGLTIVRPTYSMGAGFLISLFDRSGAELVARLRLGLPVILPDGGGRRIHVSDAGDTARMIARAVGDERAFGRDYTVGTPDGAMSQVDYIRTVADALGVAANTLEVAAESLRGDGLLEPGSLWSELTEHDLAFDLGRFLDDHPDFEASPDRAEAIRTYASHLDPRKDVERAEGPEARIASVFGRSLA